MSSAPAKPESGPTEGFYGSRLVTSPLRRVYRDDGYFGSRVVASPVRRVYRDEVAADTTYGRIHGDFAPVAPRYIGGTILSGSVSRGYYGDGFCGTRLSDSVLRRRYYGGYGDYAFGGYGSSGRYLDPHYGSRVIYDDRIAPVIATSTVAAATATTTSGSTLIEAPTRVVGDRYYDYPVRRVYGDYYDGYYGYGGFGSRHFGGGYYDGFCGGYGGYLGGYYGGSRYVSSVPRSIVRGGDYIGRYGSYIPYQPTVEKPATTGADSAEKK